MFKKFVAIAALSAGIVTSASAVTVSVSSTSNPWLAGMPDGTNASGSDFAPGQSPVLVGLSFSAGDRLRFSASGGTDHCTSGACGLAGPDGDASEGITSHVFGAQHGISNILSRIDALIGVFLGPSAPNLLPAPASLDFSSDAMRDFATLSPLLQQTFFIGDGLRNDGLTIQEFLVPTGATRLYLGTMDGFGWFNNVGTLDVTVERAGDVPEPGTLALLALALIGLASSRQVPRRLARA